MPRHAVAMRPYASLIDVLPGVPTPLPDPLKLAEAWLSSEPAIYNALQPLFAQVITNADTNPKSAMTTAVARVRQALEATTVRLPEPDPALYVPITNGTGQIIGHSVVGKIVNPNGTDFEVGVMMPPFTKPYHCAMRLSFMGIYVS